MTVSSCYFGTMSKQQHQNGGTTHLVPEIGSKGIKNKDKMAEKKEGEKVIFSLDVEMLDSLTGLLASMKCSSPLQLHGWPST